MFQSKNENDMTIIPELLKEIVFCYWRQNMKIVNTRFFIKRHYSCNMFGLFCMSWQSPDGKFIASGALDGIVNVFDIRTGKLIHTLEGLFPFLSIMEHMKGFRTKWDRSIDEDFYVFKLKQYISTIPNINNFCFVTDIKTVDSRGN